MNILNKNLIMISYFLAIIGASILRINLGPFSLFPFRIMLFFILFLFLLEILKKKKIRLRKLQIPFLGFLFVWYLYSCIQFFWAQDKIGALEQIIFFVMMLFLLVLSAFYIDDEKDHVKFFKVQVYTHIIVSIIGWYNIITGEYLLNSRYYNEIPKYSLELPVPTSVFHNQNDFAVYLAISVFFVVAVIENSPKITWKITGFIIILSTLFLIYLSASRGAIIAVAIGILLYLLLGILKSHKLNYKFYYMLFSAFCFICISIVVFVYKFKDIIESYLNFTVTDNSFNVRWNLLKNGFYFLNETKGFGIGGGNFEHYMLFKNPIYYTGGIINIHNWFGEIFVEFGYFIGITYILFIVYMLNKMIKLFLLDNNSVRVIQSKTIIVVVIVLLITSMVPSGFFQFRYHWIILGYFAIYLKFHLSFSKGQSSYRMLN